MRTRCLEYLAQLKRAGSITREFSIGRALSAPGPQMMFRLPVQLWQFSGQYIGEIWSGDQYQWFRLFQSRCVPSEQSHMASARDCRKVEPGFRFSSDQNRRPGPDSGKSRRVAGFLSGRFNFGQLPGALVVRLWGLAPSLRFRRSIWDCPSRTSRGSVTRQCFRPILLRLYFQDQWRANSRLTFDLGLRYEVDDLRDPIRRIGTTSRRGLAWSGICRGIGRPTIRGGYGIFYAQTIYALAHATNSIGEINGRRPVAQVLTTIQTPGRLPLPTYTTRCFVRV